jgi:hypothetical protein
MGHDRITINNLWTISTGYSWAGPLSGEGSGVSPDLAWRNGQQRLLSGTNLFRACREPAVANDGGKNRQLRHASLAGLGVGVASTGIAKLPLTNVYMLLLRRMYTCIDKHPVEAQWLMTNIVHVDDGSGRVTSVSPAPARH